VKRALTAWRAFLSILALAWLVPAAGQSVPELLERLRSGGYVLYMRHASTDFSQNDRAMASFEDCARQRNLTDQGRDEARAVGEHIRRLGIPVGEVLASPFCRTMETARLALQRAEATHEVRGGPVRSEDPKRYDGLRRLLSTPPPPGANRFISSHGNPFHAVAGPPYLAEGEIAVVEPLGAMKFVVITRIRVQDWPSIVP
jgi:hypothetical protein